ncbi:MAG: hypothetical protein H6936_15670 [Burkholderiales bacterium]|nr:hypothetical protein [Nitrosomonas sp.]MCP5276250.1 hypothetical protein [Burkholderiales bacterium]
MIKKSQVYSFDCKPCTTITRIWDGLGKQQGRPIYVRMTFGINSRAHGQRWQGVVGDPADFWPLRSSTKILREVVNGAAVKIRK